MARKEKRYHYIYKTTNILTGKYYIGMHSTDNLEDGYIGSGKRLWYSVKKYGKENHKVEILEFLPNRSSLIEREISIVNEDLLKESLCMNLKPGGNGGFKDKKHREKFFLGSKKTRFLGTERIKWLYANDPIWVKNVRELHNEGRKKSDYKFGSSFRGKKHKEESKHKIGSANSTNQKGKNNSQYGTCWITNGKENKKVKKTDILPENWWYGRIIFTKK
jgi:hypothetical protein